MTLTLQVPESSDTLHAALVAAATGATGGFGAFAFATSTGIDTVLAEPAVNKLLATGQFQLVIGLDAITDSAAVAAIKTAKVALPNASVSMFYNPKGGVLYHPKTMFFKRPAGGRCITGSGNLTLGGLRNNWEAFWNAEVTTANAAQLEAQWAKWVTDHKDNLLSPDDSRVTAQAALNARTRATIRKAVKETDIEALIALEEQAAKATSLNPFLIAEVSKNRPGQADLGIDAYQSFFGVTLGKSRDVTFYQVRNDGSLAPPEYRHAVAAESGNYRFEVEALSGLHHPTNDHFILIFERIGRFEFKYVLLKPGEAGHTSVQKFLEDNFYIPVNRKRRVVVAASDVRAAWSDNPLLLH